MRCVIRMMCNWLVGWLVGWLVVRYKEIDSYDIRLMMMSQLMYAYS